MEPMKSSRSFRFGSIVFGPKSRARQDPYSRFLRRTRSVRCTTKMAIIVTAPTRWM